jgi:hypothetical protein
MKLIKTEDEQGVMYSLSGDNLPDNYVLSKQNCDSLFGAVDVEKLAEKLSPNYAWKYGFIRGFNKAMELNKDKVFSLEDIKRAILFGENNTDMDSFDTVISDKEVNEFIQSLQQPTEINVEIEMENYGYCEGCRKAGILHCAHADTCGYAETRERPKLDSSGNLILKKI